MKEFFSDIPLWVLPIWGVISFALAWALYRKKSWVADIPPMRRWGLMLLRTLGLFLLGIFLLGILIKGTDKEIDQPLIITIVDDSQSMLNYSDSLLVNELSKSFLNDQNEQLKKKFNLLSFTLDSDLKNIDSLTFSASKTNLSHALNRVYDNYYGRNIGAIVLLTDGNFNSGTSPVMIAEKFKRTPIYTLSVGDTIQKVDHLVKSIVANEIAFLGNKFPVEITLEGNKTPGKSFELKLFQNGRQIDSKMVKHQDDEYSLIKVDFLLEAKQIGLHEYVVKIDALPNEFNLENNEKSFFIEVLDDRSKVLLVSEALNPDVGAVRNALVAENNLETKSVTIDELPESLKEYDLIIWFDPGVGRNPNAFSRIVSAEKPIWYFLSPQTSRETISKLKIQADFNITGKIDNVGGAFNQAFNLFKLSPETRRTIDNFPPIKSHYGGVKFSNQNSILAYQKIGNLAKTDPLIFFGTNQKLKYGVTYGIGFWLWRIADYQMNQNNQSFDELVRKSVQYLIVKENTSRLRINMPSLASSDEEFIINALFYNESYEPITAPTIQFQLSKPNGENFEYSFLALEQEYSLNLGKLPAGRYTWKASTSYNGKSFSKEGSFAVKDLELEKQATKSNHQILMQISDNSQGSFRMLSDYQETLDEIQSRDDIVPIAYESSSYKKLIDYLWLLILAITLFTTEWVIRRYSGGY